MNVFLLLLALLASESLSDPDFHTSACMDKPADPSPTCVSAPLGCNDLYPRTFYPNNVTTSSEMAAIGLQNNRPFYTTINCSPLNRLFVCLAVAPHCSSGISRPPCAALCDLVRASCASDIQELGPNQLFGCLLNCDRYPETGCVGVDDPLVTDIVPISSETTTEQTNQQTTDPLTGNSTGECPAMPYFTDSAKSFSLGWLAFWSIICFLSTALTIFTFLLDPSRFPYPWRPVIYLALSFNLHSLTNFLAMALGRDLVTCPGGQFVETSINWTWGHTPCILVFGLLYYTMMAAFLWWLMLSLSWFLASAFSWSSEAVAHLAPFYHILAWVLPLLLTIILVATRVVGADELTATCFIVRDENIMSFYALLLGVIIPLIICLITGIVFLGVGFISLLRVRAIMRHSGKSTESNILEKLMVRVGIFVVVFIIPACIMIGCFIYELVSRPSWNPVSEPCNNCTQASPAVFMVRVFMFLLTGILTGVWIWSKKTINSWRNFPKRLAACCRPKQEEEEAVPHAMNVFDGQDENVFSATTETTDFVSSDK